MIVVAYGLLLPKAVLEIPRYGCINIHGSLLPRWRGAAPIQRAIEAGDNETGITIMQMDIGLDTGNMLLKKSCPIADNETGSSLHDKLADLGGSAINEYLEKFNPALFKFNHGEKQDDGLANYAHKLSKEEAQINWSNSMLDIERKIRAFNAWPVSFTFVGEKRLRVWQSKPTETQSKQEAGKVVSLSKKGIEVVCGDHNTLLLTHLQPDGSKAMDAASLLNSKRDWFEQNPVLGSNT